MLIVSQVDLRSPDALSKSNSSAPVNHSTVQDLRTPGTKASHRPKEVVSLLSSSSESSPVSESLDRLVISAQAAENLPPVLIKPEPNTTILAKAQPKKVAKKRAPKQAEATKTVSSVDTSSAAADDTSPLGKSLAAVRELFAAIVSRLGDHRPTAAAAAVPAFKPTPVHLRELRHLQALLFPKSLSHSADAELKEEDDCDEEDSQERREEQDRVALLSARPSGSVLAPHTVWVYTHISCAAEW